jgi:MFS family permease
MSLFSKSIPDKMRGRLLGYSGAAANIIALGTAYIIGVLLKNLPFPYNCMVLFGFGIFLLFLDVIDLSLIKEPPDEVSGNQQVSYFQYIKDIPGILRNNKIYAKMVVGFAFFVVANISLTYYALYAVRVFDALPEDMALFTAISVAVSTIGSIVYGLLSDKYNHKLVLQLASLFGILAAAVVLGIHSISAIYVAFALSTLCACGYQLSGSVLIMQNCPQQELPMYISINIMVTLVISSLVTLASGFIIDMLSFQAVFLMTGAAGLGAFLVFMLLARKH